MTDKPIGKLREALQNRYLIGRELGAGGMATVYLADDLRHHRKVAIKVLRPELAEVIGRERFLREIKSDQKKNFGGARYGWKLMGGKLVDLLARIP